MNELITKEFQNFKVRTVLIDDQIWFVAKDVFQVLGVLSKGGQSDTLKSLDDDERSSFKTNTFGGDQDMVIISESGLYSVILRSRKEIAKPFQKWVTRDVLPSIRETGSYSIQRESSSLPQLKERAEKIEISTNMFQNFENIFARIGIVNKIELAITSNRAVQKETGIDFIELANKKGLETADIFLTPTELAELSKNSEVLTKTGKGSGRKMNQELGTAGFQIWIDKVWVQTESGKEFSKFVQNKSPHSEKTVYHLNWKKDILQKLDLDKQKTLFLEI